ncbi:iron-containing alcohol dehydrogenase [Candidatus Amarolinea dominans]|uniref:iron-containing alcohol dehydrogenase n=1 Tax=Candidatus Amarolinea dominans TaxID=3140696 RepID=UPI001D632ABA|nr:iron-containing alcohol dehydrogenase [Anaerolineae bacterium]
MEPGPSLETVAPGRGGHAGVQPDWIIGLGGGGSMDAAKAMWILYEYPDIGPARSTRSCPSACAAKRA